MEISASEIELLCRRISSSIEEYSLSGVYSIEGGILLRLRHSTKPEKLIAVSSFATWITTKNIAFPEASQFVSRIRGIIERERILSVEQVGNERIAKFELLGRGGERHNLYAEFFAGGNQIVAEIDGGDTILDVANPQRFRHRVLLPGEMYQLPPSRGVPLSEVNQEVLQGMLEGKAGAEKPPGNISAVRWFGRSVGTSRKFVEEVFFRAGVKTDMQAAELTSSDLASLGVGSKSLLAELEHSEGGYLLVPVSGKADSEVDAMVQPIEVDVCPIVPNSWKLLVAAGFATVREFAHFSEALDEAQVQSFVFERRRKASTEARAKAGELDSAIRKQVSMLDKNSTTARNLRNAGNQLMTCTEPEITTDLLDELRSLEIISPDENSGGKPRFNREPKAFLSSFTPRSLASRLFSEAKALEESNRKIEVVRTQLIFQKEQLEAQTLQQEERAERKLVIERRQREWFERYRWFISSEGGLVVGGRDSTSNSVVINKYTSPQDIVFHADLHGSPFFVLKDSKDAISDELALEIAQATVSFSRAWKDELGSADAFWVRASQVKKGAPSGEYLPRGSFFIEGKKNFVKHVRVELAVGIMETNRLPQGKLQESEEAEKEMPNTDQPEADSKDDSNNVLIICGPDKSLSVCTIARIRIAPGKERASSIARRIKQILISKVKDQKLKELSKRISVDEIIRSLPSGNYKIVSEKQNG